MKLIYLKISSGLKINWRKQFIQTHSPSRSAFCTLIAFFFASALAAQNLHRYEYSTPQMGTTFRIILYAHHQSKADTVAQKSFQRIAELNQIMSDYLPNSEVSRLSQKAGTKRKIKISKDLYRVLKKSKKWSRKTNGKFDITIGPLTKIWRKAFRQQAFPDTLQIQSALSNVNYKWLRLSLFSKKARLKKANMRIDLGGIAKGYAIDEAMKVIRQQGITSALVEGGGDLRYSDPPPGKRQWEVLTSDFKNLSIESYQAIATSGDTYQYLEWNGQRYSHLIHPKTGYGIQHQKTITVLANTCMNADVLASAGSFMSEKELKKWKRRKKWMIKSILGF